MPVPYALGLIAGLFTFIPYFGAFLGGIPAVMVALTLGWEKAVLVLEIYLVCHCVEGYVVALLVQRRFVELPPALTVAAMAVAGTLFGPLGLVAGTPLVAVAMVAVRMFYVEDVLGDRPAGQPVSRKREMTPWTGDVAAGAMRRGGDPSSRPAASILQRAGLISYAGGRIIVLDRAGFGAASCECYATNDCISRDL